MGMETEPLNISNFPLILKEQLKQKAEQEHRSLAAQIIHMLKTSLEN